LGQSGTGLYFEQQKERRPPWQFNKNGGRLIRQSRSDGTIIARRFNGGCAASKRQSPAGTAEKFSRFLPPLRGLVRWDFYPAVETAGYFHWSFRDEKKIPCASWWKVFLSNNNYSFI
jgi:hypothetical protein